MKKQPSRSGFIHLRVVLGLLLCVAALSMAVTAFGAWPVLPAIVRYAAERQAAHQAKLKALAKTGRSKVIASRAAAGSAASTDASPVSNQALGITEHRNQLGQTVYSIPAAHFSVSRPLTELAKLDVATPPRERDSEPERLPEWRIPRSGKPDPVVQVVPGSDQAPGSTAPDAPIPPAAATSGFNFDGISGFSLDNGYPPDENGSVGNDQFVEMVNSHFQVWSLDRTTNTATTVVPKTEINALFAGSGGACETRNDGDPIVLYDKLANRWLLSQFTSAAVNGVFYQCVAISQTPDAAGAYYLYEFAVPDGKFGDYPHYGVWTDAYYVMSHDFTRGSTTTFFASSFGAMDRAKMLAGDPSATYQIIRDPLEGGHMPADLDGFAPPPTGAPGIFTSVHTDGMYLYRMKVDWANAANTTRTLQAKMPIAPATAPCDGQGGQCIPQPNSAFTLDSLGDRLMFRLAYRNFIDHESLVVSHSVDPGVEGVVSGVRWYEFRISGQPDAVCGTYPCTYQQGTIADVPNGRSRWMPSIAQDGAGNMIVGYTATGTAEPIDAHSIRYTGRAANHPLGTMTVPEGIIQTGNRNVVSDPTAPVRLGRWGDYASTSIDPADDCTFWHVGEFYRQGQGSNTNFDWSTKIASISFNPTQCQPTTCTTRPATAPTGVTATATGANEIEVAWTGISPAPGSYAIERAIGASGSEGLYQPIGFTSGSTSYVDKTVQGGLTYTYRVIAATDNAGRCQALVQSSTDSATATGTCTFKPSFAGAISATSIDGPTCGIALAWEPGTSNCPLSSPVRYNIYRGLTPDFVPSAANRVASCVPTRNSYVDTDNLNSGQTYFYVVRAEDNSTGNGGACGGNEEQNNVVIAGTAYGAGSQATPGTWTDGGGDVTSFLRLNAPDDENTADTAWRFVRVAEDAGANHTPNGDFAYRNAGPTANDTHGSNQCAAAETPVMTVGDTTVNLTYWERHQMEVGWDGVAIEYSLNGGEWTDMPPPSNATADGCMTSDVTADYETLACTDDPPINACGYPATKPVITGPRVPPPPAPLDCTTSTTGGISDYGRRCHRLTGLAPGDTIQFRWRFTSDPATEFAGFYLDDIAVTNVSLPNACTPGVASTPSPTPTVTPTPSATVTPIPTATVTPTVSPSASPSASPSPSATASPSPSASPTPAAAQPLNISTRMVVGTNDELMIGGFIITGDAPKKVVIRAMGPVLEKSGLTNFLADPMLELRNSNDVLLQDNDNWRDDQESEIEGTDFEPEDERESVIVTTLNPGAYTALVTGKDGTTGLGLVEIYDVAAAESAQLGNISTRGFVRTGDGVMIGGFILGNNTAEAEIAVRGRGPSLSQSGLDPVLADPMLELRNANGELVVENDDWDSDPASAAKLTANGLAPMAPKEAGIFTTLPPGVFTAILFGKDEGSGIGLVEVYDIR